MSAIQAELREALGRRLARSPGDAVWEALGDAGVLGLRVPEAFGGLGLQAAETQPVFDTLGDLCLPAPYLETSVAATGLLAGSGAPAAEALLRAIAGGARVAVAGLEPSLVRITAAPLKDGWRVSGRASVVIDGMTADALVLICPVGRETGVFVVEDGWRARRRAVPTIDGRMAADIELQAVGAFRLPDVGAERVEAITDEALAALCIEAAALCRRLVRDTVAFAKQREQFGRTIGSFQVVKHRLVDMHIQARRATAISRRAVASLSSPAAQRGRMTSAAKVTACRVARKVGQEAVQLHGGMGMTEDLPIGRMFKRLTVIESQMGGADVHIARFRTLSGQAQSEAI